MKFRLEISSKKLRRSRIIQGTDIDSMAKEASAQLAIWDRIEQSWTKSDEEVTRLESLYQSDQEYYVGRDRLRKFSKEIAANLTTDAQSKFTSMQKILHDILDYDLHIDWKRLVDSFSFDKHCPPAPESIRIPVPPQIADEKYRIKLSIFDYIQPWKIKDKQTEMNDVFKNDYVAWQHLEQEVEKANAGIERNYKMELSKWQDEREKAKMEYRQEIENIEAGYRIKASEGVINYCRMVLSKMEYPVPFPKYFEMEYKKDSGILILDYLLPSLEHLPNVKEIKYVQTRNSFSEIVYKKTQMEELYDDIIYQIALGNLHLLFKADSQNALESIVFNGIVEHIDKASGQEVKTCIITIHVKKLEFLSINMKKVDPKTCFKSLKGIGSSKLHGLNPVPPLIKIERDDRRFVSAYGVVSELNESTNLAAMDWEDFEHLIRELFEKEFVHSGGEVKVTRASHDGGVDAIAFDPDPIRGGKIVIQAKRYTNLVGVSAVRDLFGTTINEGASKGILVTTSDFGPDAYEFIKDKPLTLLNGNHLLHLLAKHGYKARIDLSEAKHALRK